MPLQLVNFKPKEGYTFTYDIVAKILKVKKGRLNITLDLWLSEVTVEVDNNSVILPNGQKIKKVMLKETVKKEDYVYFLKKKGENIFPLIASSDEGKFYKLKYLGKDKAPTLEISGIHMHNIVGTEPMRDARRKAALARIKKGDKVLDICTGLGYTATASLERGAKIVLSIEKDPLVLELASYNPWSRRLADPKVKVVLGDAYLVVEELEREFFDKVIHDPPCFALAGELYSLSFYRKIFRVMRRGGVMVHYTGAPGRSRGVDVQRGVIQRLRAAGFIVVRAIKGYCVVAVKP